MEEEIRAVIAAINDAWTTGQVRQMERHLHPNVVFATDDFEPTIAGREACIGTFEEYVREATTLSFHAEPAHVNIWGDTAVATCAYAIAYRLGGETYEEQGHDVVVFTRRDGAWLAVWRCLVGDK